MTFRIIPPVNADLHDRFLSQVQRRATCWVWTGRFSGRRGVMRIGDKDLLAHRISFAWFVGDLDPSLAVKPRCGLPECVRPDHLEAISMVVSGQRGLWAGMAGRARLHDRCLRHSANDYQSYLEGTMGFVGSTPHNMGRAFPTWTPRRKAEDILMQSLILTSRPRAVHMCACGHGAAQHPSTGLRACVARDCPCGTYDRVPPPRCANCNHVPAHHPKTPQDDWACTATGCRCGQWQQPRLSESNDGNHGNDGPCVVVIQSDHREVTISIPTEAHRQVLVRETVAGSSEMVLSRPSRSRRASRDVADRSA
jgi:hypothetical protein